MPKLRDQVQCLLSKIDKMVGYNEKYPSGLTKVTFSPPLSMILIFEIFASRPNPVEPNPG